MERARKLTEPHDMKTHMYVTRRNAFGGTTTSSLCGRLNAASADGMNITGDRKQVTCGFCLKLMRAEPQSDANNG